MSRLPIPDDWDETADGWTMVTLCCPNSVHWRSIVSGSIYNLTRGRKWDERTGSIADTQRMLVAAIVGEQVDLTDPAQLSPDAVDFTATSATPGLVPKIDQMLNVDRSLYADMNIAEVLFEGLIGRRVSVPIPFEGTGLADITDEQLTTLHNRFRMADSSLFNPLNDEKNITEALETLLRRDKFTDLEFLTPNLVTVLENLFQLGGGSAILGLISGLYEWITGEPLAEVPETATTAEILMLIANAKQTASTEPQPIDLTTSVTTNVSCDCGGAGCGGCGGIGDQPPAEPGVEGDPPPTGWETPADPDTGAEITPGQPAYQSRKCKIVNSLHEQTLELVTKLELVGIVQLADELGISATATLVSMVGYIIGELTTPIPILDGAIGTVIGYLVGLVLKLIVGEVDLTALKTSLETHEDDLVCAMYNAVNTVQATNDYLQVLADNGVSIANREVILAILGTNVVNYVFFTSDQQIEAALDGYTGPVDCGVCGDLTYIHTYCGVVQGTFVSGDFNTVVVIDSVATPSVCTGPNWQFVGISPNGGGCLHFEFNVLSGSVEGISYLDCNGDHQDFAPGVTGIDSSSVHLYNSQNQPFRVEITISIIP